MNAIRPVTKADASAIADIYNYYINHTVVTFEEEEITAEDMRNRIAQVLGKDQPWIVYEKNSAVIGYAYAGEWKSRCAYRYSLESTPSPASLAILPQAVERNLW